MTVVDIHTHMLSEEYLRLLIERGGDYTLGRAPGGHQAIYQGETPFLTVTPGMLDYDLRIVEMDKAGVDVAVVTLTCPNVYWGGQEVSAVAARLVNDQMAEAQRRYGGRIRFMASLPWQHPPSAVAELDRAVALGAVGVMVLGNVGGVSLTAPGLADVWAAIDERGLPVLVHPTAPPGVDQLDMSRYHLAWSVGFTLDTTLALSRMILAGFFDTYPNLTIIGAHAGGYLPFLLSRLDQGFRSFDSVRETITQLPSSYAHRIFVDSIVYSADTLALTLRTFGPRNVLFGSDYPHKCGRMDQMLALIDDLPGDDNMAVRGGNAERIFAL